MVKLKVSFLVSEARHRLKEHKLVKLSQLIPWDRIKKRMGNLGRSHYGPKGYDPLSLFKA